MCLKSSCTQAFVYPSWAKLSYRWDDLDRILRDPIASGFVDPHTNWDAIGYSRSIHPYHLVSCLQGGGIILFETPPNEKSLGRAALRSETHFCLPVGTKENDLEPSTRYLEPMDGPLSGVSYAPKSLKKRHKRYTCITTVEASPDPELSYWALCLKPGKWKPDRDKDIRKIANQFGIELHDCIDDNVKGNLFGMLENRWTVTRATDIVYYSIHKGEGNINYSFAVLVYSAYYLASILKKQIVCACLFAKTMNHTKPINTHII